MAIIEVHYPDKPSENHEININDYDIMGIEKSRDNEIVVQQTDSATSANYLTRARGRWIFMTAINSRVTINDDLIIGLRAVTHGDTIKVAEFGQIEITFLGEVPQKLTADSLEVKRKMLSPYIRAQFVAGDDVIRCPNCGSLHLMDEWLELSQCAYLHCGYKIQTSTSEA